MSGPEMIGPEGRSSRMWQFGGSCLLLHEPTATLICCQKRAFLCISEVNGIKVDSESIKHVGHNILAKETVYISFQIIGLIPTTSNDDPELKHDWHLCVIWERTLSVPGWLIESIDPALLTNDPGKLFYLFKTTKLLALSATLFEWLTATNLKKVPQITASHELPYRKASDTFSKFEPGSHTYRLHDLYQGGHALSVNWIII